MQLKRRGVESRLIVGDHDRSPGAVGLPLLKAVARAHRWFDELQRLQPATPSWKSPYSASFGQRRSGRHCYGLELDPIYIDQDDGTERSVAVPEQGGKGAISPDPLPPGSVYTVSADGDGKVGLFRLEVSLTAGTGKIRTPAGLEKGLKESLNRAASYWQSVKDKLGLASSLAQKDIYTEAVDLTGAKVECACGVAFFVAIMSAIQNRRVQAGTVVMGDLTVQGNLKAAPSITEPLQVALDNGAIRVLVPIGNKAQFAALPEEVAERLEVIFFGDPDRAVLKSIEI